MVGARYVRVKLAGFVLCVVLAHALPARAQQAPAAARSFATERLTMQLERLHAERSHTARLWPVLTLSLGASTALTGALVGIAHVLSCDSNCTAPPWVSVAVVIGAAVGSVGVVWLVKTNSSLREIESRTHRIERDLERLQRTERERRMGALPRSLFNLRFSF